MSLNVGDADITDISYGADPAQLADVYLPRNGGNRGVIIAVHGGGFTGGDRSHVTTMFGPVLTQLERGYSIVNITYRATEPGDNPDRANMFPVAVDDVAEAVRWVRTHGAEHGLNPHTVIVAGHSAGATLAALIGTGANAVAHSPFGRTPRVDGWVSFSGIHDFTSTHPKIAAISRVWIPNSATQRAGASPAKLLDRSDPPGYLVHGANDGIVPIEQHHRMLTAAAAAGITQRLYHEATTTGAAVCRDHIPQCGMNGDIFDHWIDQVQRRAL